MGIEEKEERDWPIVPQGKGLRIVCPGRDREKKSSINFAFESILDSRKGPDHGPNVTLKEERGKKKKKGRRKRLIDPGKEKDCGHDGGRKKQWGVMVT